MGDVYHFGDAPDLGSAPDEAGVPFVDMIATASGAGFWLLNIHGAVVAVGDAGFFGDMSVAVSSPIISMAAAPSGAGYWLMALNGGIFAFGDAPHQGSAGNISLEAPLIRIRRTSTGAGYWLFGVDGPVLPFGDAVLHGAPGSISKSTTTAAGVVSMTFTSDQPGTSLVVVSAAGLVSQLTTKLWRPTPGEGYWLAASDCGVFNFGDAAYKGSTGDRRLNQPVVGMASTSMGAGYWLVAKDGGIFPFGDAGFMGSTGSQTLTSPWSRWHGPTGTRALPSERSPERLFPRLCPIGQPAARVDDPGWSPVKPPRASGR